jgi:hypothetical protein
MSKEAPDFPHVREYDSQLAETLTRLRVASYGREEASSPAEAGREAGSRVMEAIRKRRQAEGGFESAPQP